MKGGYTQYISSNFVFVSAFIPTSFTYQPTHLVASAVPSHVTITLSDLPLILISFHPPVLWNIYHIIILLLLIYNPPNPTSTVVTILNEEQGY